MVSKRNTKLARLYTSDLKEIQSRFPETSIADFVHISVRTNPLVRVEAILRGKRGRKK